MNNATLVETADLPPRSMLAEAIRQFRRLLSERLSCTHDQLVFDEINDVSCKHCGEDFTD
jgi:hypothetical protein